MVTTFAGMAGIYGTADGSGNGVRFGGCEAVFFGLFTCVGPSGVAVDGAGNLYVTDPYNSRIRKITPSGVVTTLTTLSGSRDGNSGIAADSDGNLYIADSFNEIIRKVTPGGTVTTLAGSMGNIGSADGTGNAARFYGPAGIALDSARNLYVTDAYNNTLRKVSPEGVVTTLAGAAGLPGAADGTRSAARFRSPFGVAVDSAGNAFVTDQGNHTIRKVTPEGAVSTLAGLASVRGSVDGTGNIARFNSPTGVALDSAGNLYVTDQDNNTLRKVTPEGLVTTVAGLAGGGWGSADGTDLAAQFGNPSGVTVDNEGNTYVADTDNNTIRKISPGGQVTTLAGCATCSSGMDDGAGSEARFSSPVAVTVDRAGNVYVADNNNSTIRKVTPDGVVTTLAGSPGQNGDADGTGAGAQFDHPYGLSVDDGGNVYVADTSNSTIRKVTPEGVVTTLAGMAGVSGSKDGTGGAARFSDPTGVAVDRAGNVYVADGDYATVRKITPTGVVTTIAGCATCPRGSFDGIGTDALFMQPWGIAVDNETNVYVGDYRAHTIRRITPDGVVTTVAGLAGRIGPDDGTGMGARFGSSFENEIFFETEFQGPQGLAVDSAGNIYVADNLNNTIRKGHLQPPPPVILLSGPGFSSNGQFGFSLSGTFQQVVIVEVSTNLVNWAGIWTNTLTAGLRFTDDQSGIVPTRFYRVRTE